MNQEMVIQGRRINQGDIQKIFNLIKVYPTWGRTRLSLELCEQWNWQRPNGSPKDMACRSMLLKLERKGLISLPPRKSPSVNCYRNKSPQWFPHCTDKIVNNLGELYPLQISVISEKTIDHQLFRFLLYQYHYLRLKNVVGENMKYLISDKFQRPLACALFGSAAWKTADRDQYIGWDQKTRERNLRFITNNHRVLVKNLASHVLSRIARRINTDWIKKYGHPIYLLETFVDQSRFHGTCYRASNWILVGQTKGRTRNDRSMTIRVPVKDVYIYPIVRGFRGDLCSC